jgi:hypothetical protein
MSVRLIAPLAVLALAACSDSDEVSMKNASVEEVVAKTQAAGTIEPGQWQGSTEVVSIKIPGMEGQPGAEAAMKQAIGQRSTFENCVTPEEAAKPSSKLFTGDEAGECRYDSFNMGGGTMDAVMTCKPKGRPGETRMTMKGTYTPTEYQLDMTMAMDMPGNQGMSMVARTQGKRVGECPPA